MRTALLLTIASICACHSDPCAGVVPKTLPVPVDLTNVLPARSPFEDALVGDGQGSIFLTLSAYPFTTGYVLGIYDSDGHLLRTTSGRFSDVSHARPLPQRRGFQMLEGNFDVPVLTTYDSDGSVIVDARLSRASEMRSSVDVNGGSLVIAFDYFFNGDLNKNPWKIWARRIDSAGKPRRSEHLVVTDDAGEFIVGNFAGAVTTTGWTFVAWSTDPVQDRERLFGDLFGAWIAIDGAVSSPIHLGRTSLGTTLDVAPLIGGGVAVGATPATVGNEKFEWIAQLGDGSMVPAPPSWLGAHQDTRIAIVGGQRAYAILRGTPYWQGAFGSDRCQESVPVVLLSPEGKTCGTLPLPVPVDVQLSCVSTLASAALTLDGTLVVRNAEYGLDANGVGQQRQLVRSWPRAVN